MKVLVIVCGYIGVGKTTTAKLLKDILNKKKIAVDIASVDETIYNLFERPSNINKDIPFNEQELKICYEKFASLAKEVLENGKSIILDGAFAKKQQREMIINVAKKHDSLYFVINVTCPKKIIKERTEKRFNEGKGVGWESHKKLKKNYEELDIEHYNIDSSKDIEQQLRKFLKRVVERV